MACVRVKSKLQVNIIVEGRAQVSRPLQSKIPDGPCRSACRSLTNRGRLSRFNLYIDFAIRIALAILLNEHLKAKTAPFMGVIADVAIAAHGMRVQVDEYTDLPQLRFQLAKVHQKRLVAEVEFLGVNQLKMLVVLAQKTKNCIGVCNDAVVLLYERLNNLSNWINDSLFEILRHCLLPVRKRLAISQRLPANMNLSMGNSGGWGERVTTLIYI